jgi:hypothetical protein
VSSPPSLKKSPSIASNLLDRHRHLEEDVIILGQISDLSKTITIPHQVGFFYLEKKSFLNL